MPIAFKCGKNDKGGCGIIRPEPWTGRCPGCGRFFDCRQVNADVPGAKPADFDNDEVTSIQDIIDSGELDIDVPRYESGIEGFDHVTCGGLAKKGLYLLCGDPGAGKTTLLLLVLYALSKLRNTVLYVTGEMTKNALAGYLSRMKLGRAPASFLVHRKTDLDDILDAVEETQPEIVVIDSIQTIANYDHEPGSTASIKASLKAFSELADEQGTTIIIIAHVTKEGILAGPKALEHLVDVFLYLHGQKYEQTRFLKCESKNRFGVTPRTARFQMTETGLVDCFQEDQKAAQANIAGVLRDSDNNEVGEVGDGDKPKKKKIERVVEARTLANIDLVLAIPCGIEDCRGKKGVACSSKNGSREAGFHQSRVHAAMSTLAKKPISTPITKAPAAKTTAKDVKKKKSETVAKKRKSA